MQEEFCYLNKHDNPYDWRIVEFEKRNNKEYMTISARGITKFLNGEVEFQNLDDFVRERATYNRLQQIDFFKTYKKWKTFRVWKRLMRTNIMRECARVISSKLFYLDRTLRKPLLEIRGMCCKLE
jgi:dynein heavy chain